MAVNGPKKVIFDFDGSGRIVKVEIVAWTDSFGPAGLYKQIGGILSISTPQANSVKVAKESHGI